MTFARFKIQLPRVRADLIERPQLQARLGAALFSRRLVLMVAAAGYGKTAALARQLSLLRDGRVCAWIKADEEDDLPRLLTCIAQALEPYDPPWRVAPESLAFRAMEDRGLRPVVAELTNTLATMAAPGGVLAIDDVQLVVDPRVFEFLDLLLESMPEHWTLALATRNEPPLALARLRVRGELAEFRQLDLAFSQEEIERICEHRGETESETLATALFELTQGWAAGVSLSLQGRAIGQWQPGQGERQARRHLYEYLAAEVFDRMPSELQQFLMRCSVLPELTAERCEAVTGNPRAELLLDGIEQRGLFVSELEGDVLTLRLHDLFRDFLETQLRRHLPDELPMLLKRAAEGETDQVRRINLLLRAGARWDAERALAAAAPALLLTSSAGQVARLIKLFPDVPGQGSPWLAYTSGLWSWYQLEDRGCCASMNFAAAAFDRAGDAALAQDARVFEATSRFMMGQTEAARELLAVVRQGPMTTEVRLMLEYFGYLSEGYGGSPALSAAHLTKVIELLEDDAPAVLWSRCLPRTYMLIGRPGINPLLRRFARGALAAAGDADEALHIAARQMQAWLSFWRGDLAEAAAAIEALHVDFRWHGHTRTLRLSLRRLDLTFCAAKGESAGMRQAWQGILSDEFMSSRMHPDFRMDFLTQMCRFFSAIDEWTLVNRMMRRIDSPRRTIHFRAVSIWAECCRARHALHEGRHADALRRLRVMAQACPNIDRQGLEASIRIFLAVAELRTGDAGRAWAAIAPLVEEVRISGDLAGVLMAGRTMIDELSAADWGEAAPTEGLLALQAWSERAAIWRGRDRTAPSAATPAEVRLTAREIEVVALIAQGRSNKLIARDLGLSPHTVKRHVARVLDRLGVRTRAEAASWYRAHGVAAPPEIALIR